MTVIFQNLSKNFKNVAAVRDFNLAIEDSEIMGLLGPNGAGKTTLILTMATVYHPSEGTVIVNGYDVRRKPTLVRGMIGIAFQDPRFDRLLSVYEVLEWHAKITGVAKQVRASRLEEIMRRLGLWEIRKRRTWALSGGMKKRVEDSKVFIQRPSIAVFDEPTAYLDLQTRMLVWEMIEEMKEEGRTVILATNMMDEAEKLSDRVTIMNLGSLVALGTPSQLKQSVTGGEVIEVKPSDSAKIDLEAIKILPQIEHIVASDGVLKLFVTQGRKTLPSVLEKLSEQGVTVESVYLKEASLEDVFLQYTGSKLTS
ncbi:MAG: ATP-binding cassette domain-containing protein [Thaumarchaeota archaeon]|nr:ATP-binding cassette domain-containing protein [Nitrososphaerota archaeon]